MKNTNEEQPAHYMESKIINNGTLKELDVELKKTAPLSYDVPPCGKSEFNMEPRENILDKLRNKTEVFIGMGEVPPNYRKTILVDSDSGVSYLY